MARRATIHVEWIRKKVNYRLTVGDDSDTDRTARRAIAGLLEVILHHTDNYRGFVYVDEDGAPVPAERVWADDYDDTRRRYS